MTTMAAKIWWCGCVAVALTLAGCGGGPAGMGQRGGLEVGQPMPEIVAEAWINGEPPLASERRARSPWSSHGRFGAALVRPRRLTW